MWYAKHWNLPFRTHNCRQEVPWNHCHPENWYKISFQCYSMLHQVPEEPQTPITNHYLDFKTKTLEKVSYSLSSPLLFSFQPATLADHLAVYICRAGAGLPTTLRIICCCTYSMYSPPGLSSSLQYCIHSFIQQNKLGNLPDGRTGAWWSQHLLFTSFLLLLAATLVLLSPWLLSKYWNFPSHPPTTLKASGWILLVFLLWYKLQL